jgi:hypothetical protein
MKRTWKDHRCHRREQNRRQQREQRQIETGARQSADLDAQAGGQAHCGQSNRTLIPGRKAGTGCTGSSFTSNARTS